MSLLECSLSHLVTIGAVYMSPANRASPGNLLKETDLILAMKDHRDDIGKFS